MERAYFIPAHLRLAADQCGTQEAKGWTVVDMKTDWQLIFRLR